MAASNNLSFEPAWSWPSGIPGEWAQDVNQKDAAGRSSSSAYQSEGLHHRNHAETAQSTPQPTPTTAADASESAEPQPGQRHYGPRTCRICLEVVQPSFEMPNEHLPEMLQGRPSIRYYSEDGGRLIRPCLCKGSQKYVHEGCLAAWRLQDPNNRRNYWQCPTCKYSYQLQRMAWGHWIQSAAAQLMLTLAIFLATTFLLGYIADPIINLYLDPYSTVTDAWDGDSGQHYYEPEPDTWFFHFVKGTTSLGLLGFAKFLLTMSPFHWFNVRLGGGQRAGTTGRDRMQQISWFAVVVGVTTVLWAVWKGVRAWSKKTLTRASERVMDVPLPDGADDEDDE